MGGSWPGRSCVGTTLHLGGTCQPARLLSAGQPDGCSVGRLEPSGADSGLWRESACSLSFYSQTSRRSGRCTFLGVVSLCTGSSD